jgi:hypothetical protein
LNAGQGWVGKVLGIDTEAVGGIADAVALDCLLAAAAPHHENGEHTKLHTSSVFEIQLSGIDPRAADNPLTFNVVVPPFWSTLQARPAVWLGSPIKKTPLTAAKLSPVICESALTVAEAPCE